MYLKLALLFSPVVCLCVPLFLFAQQDSTSTDRYVSTFEQGEGTNIVLLYIGSQNCGPCHRPEIKAAVEKAKILLQKRATLDGKRFSTIGVIKNYNWKEGLKFIEETGYFDEIVGGRSWFNSAVVEHCYKREDGRAAIPQLIVFEQTVTRADGRYNFGQRHYLATVVGAEDIPEWVTAGAPLPYSSKPSSP